MSKSTRRSRPPSRKESTSKRESERTGRQTKKQIAFGRREARQRRIIWLSIGLLAVVIIAVLVVGLVREVVAKPGTAVATVNGEKVRLDEYQALLTLYRFNLHQGIDELTYNLQQFDPEDEANQQLISLLQNQMSLYQTELVGLPDSTLDQLIEDRLIAEKARELGLAVSDAEVDGWIDDFVTPATETQPITDTETVATATPIPQSTLDAAYRNWLQAVGISSRDHRAIVRSTLLRDAVADRLASEVPTTGLVAHVQQIQTDTQEEADKAQARLEAGEDFAGVASELSTDPQVEETGGDLGWIAPGQMVAQYGEEWDTVVFGLEVGAVKQIASNSSFYVVQVLERDEDGPLPEAVLQDRKSSALYDWLEAQTASPEVAITRLLQPDQIPEDPFATF